jgi:hypothetical protein
MNFLYLVGKADFENQTYLTASSKVKMLILGEAAQHQDPLEIPPLGKGGKGGF